MIRAFPGAPEMGNGFDAIRWAAYHAPMVAQKLNVVRQWLRGDVDVLREMARSLPVVAALIEREAAARAPF